MGPCIVSISNKMQRYTVYLYLETALHVSGGTSTHHQEHIQLYLQLLVFVTTPLLLSAAIVEELEKGLSVLWVAYATHSTLKPVSPQCWICFIPLFWHLEFRGVSQIFGKFVQPCFRQLKIKAQCSFKTSGTDYPLTRPYIQLIGILNHTWCKPSPTWLHSSK
jgi:hypothetical protein